MVGLGKEEIKWAVLGAWDIIVEGVLKEKDKKIRMQKAEGTEKTENKWSLESRSKLKSIGLALSEHEDAAAGMLHFVKYAEYMLPRSGMDKTLEELLKKVGELRKSGQKPEIQREMLSHLVGYLCWSIDAYCQILTDTKAHENPENAREPLKNMFSAEFTVLGIDQQEKMKDYVEKLIKYIRDNIKR
ncbi:MAG: hypothetical protein ACP5LE_04105 [Thermoplasmata archaeon]